MAVRGRNVVVVAVVECRKATCDCILEARLFAQVSSLLCMMARQSRAKYNLYEVHRIVENAV